MSELISVKDVDGASGSGAGVGGSDTTMVVGTVAGTNVIETIIVASGVNTETVPVITSDYSGCWSNWYWERGGG